MTRVCSGCGLMRCEGDCYLASPSDFEAETPVERPAYTPSPEYLLWCESVDAEQASRLNKGLAPRDLAA